jgi:hypothetical protein
MPKDLHWNCTRNQWHGQSAAAAGAFRVRPLGVDRGGKAQRLFERVAEPTGGRNVAWQEGVQLNAWCELAKSLKRKGGFTDTQTESRLVQGITPLFSMTAFQ